MEKHTGKKVATFQERFSILCEENPKSITSLAKELNVSKQTISAWRTGARSPKSLTATAIASHFDVNLSWLMGFDVERLPYGDKKIVLDMQRFGGLGLSKEDDEALDDLVNIIVKLAPKNRKLAKKILLNLMEDDK